MYTNCVHMNWSNVLKQLKLNAQNHINLKNSSKITGFEILLDTRCISHPEAGIEQRRERETNQLHA